MGRPIVDYNRSCHDAIAAIYTSINRKPKYVLDADIKRCFDTIDHEALLVQIDTYPQMRRQIAAWLKAGVMSMSKNTLMESKSGTPQGGSLRPPPLLANITLHGIEEVLENWISEIPMKCPKGRSLSRIVKRREPLCGRYRNIT